MPTYLHPPYLPPMSGHCTPTLEHVRNPGAGACPGPVRSSDRRPPPSPSPHTPNPTIARRQRRVGRARRRDRRAGCRSNICRVGRALRVEGRWLRAGRGRADGRVGLHDVLRPRCGSPCRQGPRRVPAAKSGHHVRAPHRRISGATFDPVGCLEHRTGAAWRPHCGMGCLVSKCRRRGPVPGVVSRG